LKRLPVVILAGYETDPRKIQKNSERLKRKLGVEYLEGINKGLIGQKEVGYSILQKLIDTYKETPFISEITVVGPEAEFREADIQGCYYINYNKSIGENIKRGILEYKGSTIAMSTVDIPYVENHHLINYYNQISKHLNDKDLIIQFVDSTNIRKESKWKPSTILIDELGSKRSVVPGHFYIVNTNAIPEQLYEFTSFLYQQIKGEPLLKKLYGTYKKSTALIDKKQYLNLGYAFLKLFFHKLKVSDGEKLAENILFKTHIAITNEASFAADIDEKYSEYKNAISYLEEKKKSLDRIVLKESKHKIIDSALSESL